MNRIKEKINGLNDLINEGVNKGIFPGANYCLVTKDDTYFASFGKKSLFPLEDNNINTLYDMASCSKVISTTTSIMLLMERGKLRLYDNVSKYLENFPYSDILIWDLLTHTSGLPADVHRANNMKSREELTDTIWKVELKYPKNTKIVYSDIGFILLGMIVEKISGETLDEFARKNIFEPLEMFSTGYNPQDINRCAPTEKRNDEVFQGIVRGKVHDEKAYIMGGVAGHAGLFSCVSDLEHFIQMILNNGVYNNTQFLSRATIDLLFTPMVKETKGVSLNLNTRGLGWIVQGDYCSAGDLASPETILHTGFTGTNIFIDRINKVGFTLLSNRVHPTRENVKLIPFRGMLGNYIIANFGGRNEY